MLHTSASNKLVYLLQGYLSKYYAFGEFGLNVLARGESRCMSASLNDASVVSNLFLVCSFWEHQAGVRSCSSRQGSLGCGCEALFGP
jgi:hypothetical protein